MVNVKGLLAIAVGCAGLALFGCGGSDGNAPSRSSCGSDNAGSAGKAPSDDGKTPPPDSASGTGGAAGSDGAVPENDAGVAGGPSGSDGGSAGTGDDAGSTGTGDAGSPDAGGDAGAVTMPAPLVVTGACAMRFSDAYVGGSGTAQVRGALPGLDWNAGPTIVDSDADHYLEYASSGIGAGYYEFTYMVPPSTWADYGADEDVLRAMTPAARAYVNCNWWDPYLLKEISVSSRSCDLRIMVGGGCAITPAGNMKDFK